MRRPPPVPDVVPLRVCYRVKDVARILGVGLPIIYKGIHEGKIPCLQVGRLFLITRDTVDWLLQYGMEGDVD
jgi:excisionase family DNA binding protein